MPWAVGHWGDRRLCGVLRVRVCVRACARAAVCVRVGVLVLALVRASASASAGACACLSVRACVCVCVCPFRGDVPPGPGHALLSRAGALYVFTVGPRLERQRI